ncbi:MAG: SPOR domain-containing protein [Flavobacteriales bacterium]|jgi:hypothetical protein|nr:SPOR domain-containing protein [Flavobacteriales bacterium]HJN64297.1 SPOR domain-containing protein [Flavobacteriales bacterium]|tara:strand:- start:1992 stop:2402 length:411 start_codon:yes stop_codon:yes gene_type:complete
MIKYLFTIFLFSSFYAIGQTNSKTDSTESAITNIEMEEKVGELLDRHIKLNKKRKGMLGWRLQIHSDTDREKAKKIRISFMLKFPEIPAYLVHKEPYFKVTVGDFYTRLEALKVQNEIRRRYTSYIVPSNINLADD